MTLIYKTNEWNGYGKQNYFWHEYRLEGLKVVKFKCNRRKFFDGDENTWVEKEEVVESWNRDDESLPEWLNNYL